MTPRCFRLPLAALLAAIVVAPAVAQAPPPPPGDAPPPPAPGTAPPPPPAPPPSGPSVILDHAANGFVHVDVHCGDNETTRACVDIASQLYDKLNGQVQAK